MATLPSGLADIVDDEEDLVRFLTSSGHYNTTMVKPAAFLPKDGETSVSRHGREPRDALWQIGRDVVGADRSLHGAAFVKARHIRDALLDAVPVEPPPRHAIIIGWTSSATDPELAKAEQKQQSLLIVQHASFLLYDSGAEP